MVPGVQEPAKKMMINNSMATGIKIIIIIITKHFYSALYNNTITLSA
jgi:hypothetical protein